MPVALRAWCGRNVLGGDAGEALVSPLTFSSGVFSKPPTVHADTVGAAGKGGVWGWGIDDASSPGWRTEPWPHDVLVMVTEGEQTSVGALVKKAWATVEAGRRQRLGRRVLVLLATQRKRESLDELGARIVLYIPAGCWHHVRGLTPAFSVSFWF